MFSRIALILAAVLPGQACARADDPVAVTPRPEVLSGAFAAGFVGEADDERYPVRVVRIGEVRIASGRVIVADPFLMSARDQPLTVTVPAGRYPVDLAVADAGTAGHRVALARLLLSDQPAVRWSLAVTADQNPQTLRGDEIFGYPVDAGTGAFIDAAVPAWLAVRHPPSDVAGYQALTDGWQARGEARGPELGVPYGFILVEDFDPGGVAMFSSGWGDGYYASWVGYGADDRPVAIVTDFAVIEAVNLPPAR
jgi:hypothetical protein